MSSLDSYRLEIVRECRFDEFVSFDTGKAAVRAAIFPGIVGQDFGWGASDIFDIVLTARHEGTSIDCIDKFPFFVHVAATNKPNSIIRTPFRVDEIQSIGWGELYQTYDAALYHRFH